MKDLEVRTDSFIGYIPKNKKDYLKFIQLILCRLCMFSDKSFFG